MKPTVRTGGRVSGGAGSKADATLTVSSSGKFPRPAVQIAPDAVQTICNYEGIKVQVTDLITHHHSLNKKFYC